MGVNGIEIKSKQEGDFFWIDLDDRAKEKIITKNKQTIGLVLFGAVAGSTMFPAISIGSLVGVAMVVKNFWMMDGVDYVLNLVRKQEERTLAEKVDLNSYAHLILSKPLNTCLLGPLIEEASYRIILQEIFLSNITINALGPMPAMPIVGSALSFGAMHLRNGQGFENQALKSVIDGIALGALCAMYGPMAPIAAHIINNTMVLSELIEELEKNLS